MKKDIAIMADPDTVTGFMLGGIKSGFPVHNTEESKTTGGSFLNMSRERRRWPIIFL
jgi:vacuolar-type H+-ATPase subunit F/Vma7